MRAGLVLYGDLGMTSGGFLYDRELVRHLRKEGDRVDVVSLDPAGARRGFPGKGATPLVSRLADFAPDLLLEDELAHRSLFSINSRLRARLGCPLIAIVHHLKCCEGRSGWRTGFIRRVEKKYLQSVDGFICTSRATLEEVSRLSPSRPSIVAYPGGDRFGGKAEREALREKSESTPFRILFLGNLISRKEVHTLISGLSLLGRSGWELLLAGSSAAEPAYARRISLQVKRARLEDRVKFLGPVADGALPDLFSRSHVLAVPSAYEGFGIVYLEGMSFGLPAIASSAGGAREIVREGVNGFLVSPGDPEAVAVAVWRLLEDRKRLLAMSLAALDRSAEFPGWEESCARVRNFLIERLKPYAIK